MNFRLTTILYIFALLAAALAAFGAWGILVLLGVLILWASACGRMFSSITEYVVILFVCWFLWLLTIPAASPPIGSWPRQNASVCSFHVESIADGMIAYDREFGRLPTNIQHGKNDLHSWRVELLREFDEALYQRIDVDVGWDAAINRPITNQRALEFHCDYRSISPQNSSDYYVVVGPQTFYVPEQVRSLKDCRDARDTTLLLLEAKRQTPWAKPEDLPYEQAVELLTSVVVPAENGGHVLDPGYFYKEVSFRHAAMADGSVIRLACPLSRETAEAILTIDGGESVPLSALTTSYRSIDWPTCISFALFLLLALAPLPKFIGRARNPPASGSS